MGASPDTTETNKVKTREQKHGSQMTTTNNK
jgi:hypothetical protein